VNVQLTFGEKTLDVLTPEPLAHVEAPPVDDSEDGMEAPVINWHRDSYGMSLSF
jgi:hypothetical protein